MYIKKWLAGWGILFLLTSGVTLAKNYNTITLTFGGATVSSDIKVIEKNGAKYINLQFLNYLHVISDWDPTDGALDLRMGKYSIMMYEGSTRYRVNGGRRKLTHAIFQQDNQLWLPVEFILRLGLVVKKQDRKHLSLDWQQNYLLGIENVKYQERPAFLLIGAESFKTTSFLLTKPNRLVVDLKGVKAHFTLDCNTHQNPAVKKFRFRQLNSSTVRLVFDLNQMVGYKIIPHPEEKNQVLIVFNYLVEEVNFFQQDDERKVYIKSTFPAVYSVKSVTAPNRLIIDFDGATLTGTSKAIVGDGQWISQVRMSQFKPETVRVVLDLAGTAPCFVIQTRDNPNLIKIRTVQTIQRISWTETEQSGKLTIEADGELDEELAKDKNSGELHIGFDFTQFKPGLQVPVIKSDIFKKIQPLTVSSTEVKLDIDLSGYISYDTELSPDRRKLTINFKQSPLIGKTILVDAGHGGVDPGACGRQGTREKDVNLEVIMLLKNLLEEAGAYVVLSRSDDIFISLYERSFIANYLFADSFISIHTNNHPNLNVQGIEVFHLPGRDDSKLLAQCVFDSIVKSTGFNGLGVKTNDFVVVREPQMPSILVELGFLSNFQEESIIKTFQFKEKAAAGIFQGIIKYYQN